MIRASVNGLVPLLLIRNKVSPRWPWAVIAVIQHGYTAISIERWLQQIPASHTWIKLQIVILALYLKLHSLFLFSYLETGSK